MKSRGGWGKGVRSHPNAYYIRFTDEEDQRLSKLLRRRRLTMQAFGHAAIIRALNEAELGKKTDEETEKEREREREKSKPPVMTLGIRERIRSDDDEWPPRRNETPTVSQATPMLAAASTDDTILALARTVVEAPSTDRREALKRACRALTRGRTLDEAKRLADDLDAAIQRLQGTPQTVLERVRARTNSR